MRADDLTSEYYTPVQIYLIVGVMHFFEAFSLSMGVRWIERTLTRSRLSRRKG